MRCGKLLFFLVLLGATSALAQPPVIFLVRHAERADAGKAPEKDPHLSAIGTARAQSLARTLRDAQIVAIFTTEFRRTQETAAPLAHSLGIKPQVVPAKELTALVHDVQSCSGNALVVGHSNTLPEIARAFGCATPLKIGETEYDDLFLLVSQPMPRLIHLHYR